MYIAHGTMLLTQYVPNIYPINAQNIHIVLVYPIHPYAEI